MSDEQTPAPEPEPPAEDPAPDTSPFPVPPLDAMERSDPDAKGDGAMTDARSEPDQETFDPAASPFAQPPVAGIPYERGSEEDEAVRAVIAEAERARRTNRASTQSKP